MTRFDQAYFDRVTATVDDIETKTSAEIVVAIYPQSGSYRDADLLCGALAAFGWLLFAIFNPWFVHPAWLLPVELGVIFGIGMLTSFNVPKLRNCLTTKQRREEQVRTSAAGQFVEDGVTNTRGRTGLLIYLSRLEQQVEVLADTGILDRVAATAWNETVFELHKAATAADPAEALLTGLGHVGELLASELPASEDNPDEIPNAPRTES